MHPYLPKRRIPVLGGLVLGLLLALLPLAAGAVQDGDGVISGTVTNGTTGRPVPDLAVDLAVFNDTALVEQRSTRTDSNGAYRFDGLPGDPDLVFVARAEYPAGVPNSSEFVRFADGQTALDLPITVYETTSDASGIRLDRVHYIVEFEGGQAQIAELHLFSLEGDRTYVGDGAGVLRFELPPGALNLGLSDGELGDRYLLTETGFVDTLPLPPGQNVRQVLYRYTVPYAGGRLDLERSLAYPAANVNALIADVGQQVTSNVLTNQGLRQTQNGNYYNLVGRDIPVGQPISIRLVGLPAAGGGQAAGDAAFGRIALYILAALAAAAAALLALWPVLRRRARAELPAGATDDREGLIAALASLDAAYRAGEITEAAYRDRRMRLKARLLDAVRRGGR